MFVLTLALFATHTLVRATTIWLPGPLAGVLRVPDEKDAFYVQANKRDTHVYLRANVFTGATKVVYSFDASTSTDINLGRVFKRSNLDRSGLVSELVSRENGSEEVQYVDPETGRAYAKKEIPRQGPRVSPPFRYDEFPFPRIPKGHYITPEGRHVQIVWDSPEGRFGFEYQQTIEFGLDDTKPIEFEPGSWRRIEPRKDGAERYGREGGMRGNSKAMPNRVSTGMAPNNSYKWFDSEGQKLIFEGSELDYRNGRWFKGGGEVRCIDSSSNQSVWVRKSLNLGSGFVSANPVVPYRNGSWIGDYLVAATFLSKNGEWWIVILDSATGKTVCKLLIRKQDRLVAICESYLLVSRYRGECLERWVLR